ncbi:threonine/serine ThrE exporter family protein [Nocardioides euryhalodurans]|uniref:Threonine/serine exporter family protein n=1 Tax=Nocardioides euryhalodurans TaxID=2518370 RepID=A0A4P7GN39_9ACTN|nr:threonine/serine exporter family protein [Nocardioides euryhalodurans]QBR93217.1 threonine/serine exporter family protein [Nocardioides euryhalodurans]
MTSTQRRPRVTTRVPSMPVLDLTMRVGDHLLASGMSANDVVVQMLRVTRAYGLSGVHVDLTYTSISVTHHRGPTRQPLSIVRVVQPLAVNYTKVRDLDQLLARIEDGLSIDRATLEYEQISLARPPYPAWVANLGSGGIAAGASLTFSTSWVLVLISFVAAASMDRLMGVLNRKRVPPFFGQALVAGAMTMVAAGVFQLGQRGWWLFEDLDPTLIVVGGIVMLLAGVMIVGAVQDAIDQFYVTASARMLEVVMRTAGITAGILVALTILESQGFAFEIVNSPTSTAPLWAQYAGAGVIALSFAVYCYADIGTIALTTSISLVGWSVYVALASSNSSEIVANTTAALVVGFLATVITRSTNAPGFGMESGALLPLVPGLTLLNGLLKMMAQDPGNPAIVAGGRTLFVGILVALGIAAGATLGTYLGRPVDEQVRRLRRRVKSAGRAVARPDRAAPEARDAEPSGPA